MSILPFAIYGELQRPVIDASKHSEKVAFMILIILFAQFDLLSMILIERSEWLAETEKEAVTQPIFLSFCLFNSKYRDSFTIYRKPSPWNSPSSLVSLHKPPWMMIYEFQNIDLDIV